MKKRNLLKVLSPLMVITLIGSVVFASAKNNSVATHANLGSDNATADIGKAVRLLDAKVNTVSLAATIDNGDLFINDLPKSFKDFYTDSKEYDKYEELLITRNNNFVLCQTVCDFRADLFMALSNIYTISREEISELEERYYALEHTLNREYLNDEGYAKQLAAFFKKYVTKLIDYVVNEEPKLVNEFIEKVNYYTNVKFDDVTYNEASNIYFKEYLEVYKPHIKREELKLALDFAVAGLFNKITKYKVVAQIAHFNADVAEIELILNEAQEHTKDEIMAAQDKALTYKTIVEDPILAGFKDRINELIKHAESVVTELNVDELAVNYTLSEINKKYANAITFNDEDVDFCKFIVESCNNLKYKKAFRFEISQVIAFANKVTNVRARQSAELDAYVDEFNNNFASSEYFYEDEGYDERNKLAPFKLISEAGHSEEFTAKVNGVNDILTAKFNSYGEAFETFRDFVKAVLKLDNHLSEQTQEETDSEILALLDTYWTKIVPSYQSYPKIEQEVYHGLTATQAYIRLCQRQSIYATQASLFNTYYNYLLEEFGTTDYNYLTLDGIHMASDRLKNLTASCTVQFSKAFYKSIGDAKKEVDLAEEDRMLREEYVRDFCNYIQDVLDTNGSCHINEQQHERLITDFSDEKLNSITNPDLTENATEIGALFINAKSTRAKMLELYAKDASKADLLREESAKLLENQDKNTKAEIMDFLGKCEEYKNSLGANGSSGYKNTCDIAIANALAALDRYNYNQNACEFYVSQVKNILDKRNQGRVKFFKEWGMTELKEYNIYELSRAFDLLSSVKNPDLQDKVNEANKAYAELNSYITMVETLAVEFNTKTAVYNNDKFKFATVSKDDIVDIYNAYKAFDDANVSTDITDKFKIEDHLAIAKELRLSWEANNEKVTKIAEIVKALNEDAKDIDKYVDIHNELNTLLDDVLNVDLQEELTKVNAQYGEFESKLDRDTAIVKYLGQQYEEFTTKYITSSELAKADELDKQYSEVKFVTSETRKEYEAKRAWIEEAKAQRNSDYNSITSAFDILNKGIDGRHCSMKDLDQYNEMIDLVSNINAAYKNDFTNDEKVGKYYDEVCLQNYRNKYAMALTIYNNDKSMAAKYVNAIEAGLNTATATANEINTYKQKYGEFANLDKNHKGDFAKTLLKKQSLAPYKKMYNDTVAAYKKEWQGLNDLYNDFWVSPIKAWSKVVDEYGHLKPEETAKLIGVITEAQKSTKRSDIREEYEKIYITLLTKFAPDPTFDLSVVFGGSEPYGECPVSYID